MRKKREIETPERRTERLARESLARVDRMSAEEAALDAAVRRSIELHGA
jgi:hypothetical protein